MTKEKRLVVIGCNPGVFNAWTRQLEAFYVFNTSAVGALIATYPYESLEHIDVVFIDPYTGLVSDQDKIFKIKRPARADYQKIAQITQEALNALLARGQYKDVLVDATNMAMFALEGWHPSVPVEYIKGGKNIRQNIFLQWLKEEEEKVTA